MKSAKLEWCLGDVEEAKNLLKESVELYPEYAKLWMMKGQIHVQEQRPDDAREDYKLGVSAQCIKFQYQVYVSILYLLSLAQEVSNVNRDVDPVLSARGKPR